MGTGFWVKRFLVVLVGAFVVIGAAQLLIRGHSLSYSVVQGAVWGFITAAVFTGARFFQARNGQHCAICKDTPEARRSRDSDA